MNWIFTRPGRVRFAKGEPFCFITLVQDKVMETFDLIQHDLVSDPDLHDQYEAWRARRDDFNARLYKRDPATTQGGLAALLLQAGEMPSEEALALQGACEQAADERA